MRKLTGLNYYEKLETIVQECITNALSHPFEDYIFITDHKEVVESIFLKYTPYLVNIEILSWSQYLKQLQVKYHLTKHHLVSHIELVYTLQHILHHESFYCFHSENPYPIINKLIPLLKDMDLCLTDYQKEYFKDQPKLVDYINIYHSLKESLDEYTHLSLEDIVKQCSFNHQKQHLYIEADHLYQPLRQKIITQLSQFHDVTLMYTYRNDDRLMNIPYHQLCYDGDEIGQTTFLLDNLFLQAPHHCDEDQEFYTFTASSPQQEVKYVVNTIYQKIVDDHMHYNDFVIVYPDSSYIDILIQTLNEKKVPHNLPVVTSNQYDLCYQRLLNQIDELSDGTVHEYANSLMNDNLSSEYVQYLESLMNYNDFMKVDEFKEFFKATCIIQSIERLNNQDHISIYPIQQLRTDQPKHIFILGMNETILPTRIKDTSLLLNEDIEILRQNHITTPLTTLEQLGVHHNDIMIALQQPYMTMTFSYSISTLDGQTRLPSSLYKQLKEMYNLKPLPLPQYLSMDDYYLKGGETEEKEKLNKNIQKYLKSRNQPDSISSQTIQQLYSPTLSVSQIETYNKCPFLYFIQYGLGIYPLKEEKLMPNELGSLIHYVLSININDDKDINMLVDNYIQKDETLLKKIQSSHINQYFIDQIKKDLKITLDVLYHILDISSFEVSFKEKKIEDTIQGIQFKGFVDRIDSYNQYVSIIDYKSSSKDIDLNLAMQGFNIQMLLYLKVVSQQYHKDPGAVLYFNTKKRVLSAQQSLKDEIDKDDFYAMYRYGGYIVDDENHEVIKAMDPYMDKKSNVINVTYVKSRDEYKGHILTPQQLDKLFEEIEKHIYELYLEMINGHISISPKGSDQSATHTIVNPCHYCVYHNICQFDPFYNDYDLVEFYNVEEKLGGEEDAV